ncbi:MAG: Nif3-like dinuclear metal center hexameric protein [Lentimicrobiaceae bacterium]|nr:Nif3-like dinuclear metal center hexameric protein [Lentimicrobiaceae bacterium]
MQKSKEKFSVAEVVAYLEKIAPPCYQESYDNSGLQVGDMNNIVTKGLVCLDLTPAVMKEAVETGANLIITHHPLIFNPLKKIAGTTVCEKLVIKAVKNDIAVYSMHTNLDNVHIGVNAAFAQKLQLKNVQILRKNNRILLKLITFVPVQQAENVRENLFRAGAGHIGNYQKCSYNSEGTGTFEGNDSTNPFVGEKNKLHYEKEMRLEVILPVHLKNKVVKALLAAHPYEEPAYDLILLENTSNNIGAGMIGELENAMSELDFLQFLKEKMQLQCIKHSQFRKKTIKKVAICGGSGSFLIPDAIKENADVFISSELKHNHFLDFHSSIFLADIGHFESEIEIKNQICAFLIKKFSIFANSEIECNPIAYF